MQKAVKGIKSMLSGATFLQNFQHFSGKKYLKLWSGIALYHPHQPADHLYVTPNMVEGIGHIIFLSFNTIFLDLQYCLLPRRTFPEFLHVPALTDIDF